MLTKQEQGRLMSKNKSMTGMTREPFCIKVQFLLTPPSWIRALFKVLRWREDVLSREKNWDRAGIRSDEGLALKTSAFNLFTVADLPYQLSW